MKRLGFTINREVITFEINEKSITYFDRKWPSGVSFMPRNSELIKHLLMNQRRFPAAQKIIEWINEANSGSNLEEYTQCVSEDDVVEIVRRDAMSKGLVEIK